MITLTEEQKNARSKICLPLDGLNTLLEVENRLQKLSV